MSEHSGYIDTLRKQTGLRLFVLFAAFFIFLIAIGGISGLIMSIPGIGERNAILISSALQNIFAFSLPAWLAARFASDHPMRFLGLTQRIGIKPFIGVVIVFIVAMPAMNWLIAWNESVHFPDWAAGFEKTLRGWEESNSGMADKALAADSFLQMLVGILVIGMLTGIGEESFFRGGMQRIFCESGCKTWIAVWGGAFVFSAFHFQFFGFLPRMLMGAFFGYLLVWTGSLWPGIFAHALNNSTVVVAAWIFGDPDKADFMTPPASGIPWGAIVSATLTIMLLTKYKDLFFTTTKQTNG